MFVRLPRPQAVVWSCLIGTLFLPEIQSSPVAKDAVTSIRMTLLDFSKVNVMSYGLLLGLVLFDLPRLAQIRWNIFDVPALALVIIPTGSSLCNDNSLTAAFAEFRALFLVWIVPYLVGRVYLSDSNGVRLVTLAIAAGGIIYIPFCLYEVRMAPVLHYQVYGFQQHDFSQTVRLGGYRPMVFMQHGLAVGLWMVVASLCLGWLWRCGHWPTPSTLSPFRNFPRLTIAVQLVTTVLCKSIGALVIGLSGAVALALSTRLRTRLFLTIFLLAPPLYLTGRILGWCKSEQIVSLFSADRNRRSQFNQERTDSLEYRLQNEEKLMSKLGNSFWYGMGCAGSRPKDDEGRPIVPDSQWIITYFDGGVFALAALLAFFLAPGARFLYLHRTDQLASPQVAPATVAAVVLAVVMNDCLLNAMLNPMYLLLVAALNGWNSTARHGHFDAKAFYNQLPANVSR